jgi:hypothetical protein
MRTGSLLAVGGVAVLAALGALVWSVRSSEPPASSTPVAADPPGPAPSPPAPPPPSLAWTPIPSKRAEGAKAATASSQAPAPAASGKPVETDPRAPGYDPVMLAASRQQDPFAAIEAEPRDEAFAGPRETALLGIVQSRLDTYKVEGVEIDRAECFASSCVMELGIAGGNDGVALALEAIQSGPLADSVTFEGAAPTGQRTRIRVGVFYGPDSRDHESFLSRIGSAGAP